MRLKKNVSFKDDWHLTFVVATRRPSLSLGVRINIHALEHLTESMVWWEATEEPVSQEPEPMSSSVLETSIGIDTLIHYNDVAGGY